MKRRAARFCELAARAGLIVAATSLAAQSAPPLSAQPAGPAALEAYALVHQWPDRAAGPSGLIQQPVSLDVSLDGRVYLSDAGVGGVHVMLPSGDFLSPIGTSGDPEARMGAPGDLSVDQLRGKLYVLDRGSDRVVVYDLDGQYLSSWEGVPGVAIAAATDGRVYVADPVDNRMRVFDDRGAEQFTFGGQGSGAGEFSLLTDISISHDGSVLAVGDLDGLRVQLFEIGPSGADLRLTYDLTEPKYSPEPRSTAVPYMQCRAGVVNALGGDDVWVGDGSGACHLARNGHTYTIAASAGSGTICKQTVELPLVRPGTGQYYAVAAYDPNVGPCYSTRRAKDTALATTPAVVQYDDPELKRVRQISLSSANAKEDGGLVGPSRLSVPKPGTVFVQDSSSYSRFFGPDGSPLATSAMRTRFAAGVKCRRWIEIAEGSDVTGEVFGYFRHEHLTKDGKEPDCPGT